MEINQIRECQLWQLDALKFVDKICRENELKYFAHTGTLLGAARHGGYIPWDMDTDILMPREDCEKLVGLIKEIDDPNYSVTEIGEGIGYSNRVIAYTVRCFGTAVVADSDKYIHIDIYSYDHAKKLSRFSRKYYSYKSRLLHRLINFRNGVRGVKNALNKALLVVANVLYKNKTDEQIRDALTNAAVSKTETGKVTVFNSFYGFGKETYPKSYFEETTYLPFEDMEIPAPKEYEAVLTNLYGNWRALPPEDKRYPNYLDVLNFEVLGKKETK